MKWIFTGMLLALCSPCGNAREIWRRDVVEVMGGAAPLRLVSESESVQVWRLIRRESIASGELGGRGETTEVQAEDEALMLRVRYSCVDQGKVLSAEQTVKLKALVLAPTSYAIQVHDETGQPLIMGGQFSPLIRIRFLSGGSAVEMWISFSWARAVLLDERKVLGGSEINPMRQELLALLKSALAEDTVLAKTK